MGLADETLINAKGFEQFDVADNSKLDDKRLDFSHIIAATFNSTEGKQVLDAMVKKYLVRTIANNNDSLIAIGRKQGEADVIHYILGQIELSANS